jgi:hypothetical protein
MILLWGHAGDRALKAVYEALLNYNVAIGFIDHRQILQTEIFLSADALGGGIVSVDGCQLDLGQVSAAYLRPFDSRWLTAFADVNPGSPDWYHALAIEDCLLSWAEMTSAMVANRPTAMATNTSKPYQSARLQMCGFAVPETLITTDPNAVHTFLEKHGSIIFKSVSARRSIVARLNDQHKEWLSDIAWCPTQFQEYIPGTDYRVHIVGDEVFTCEVSCSVDDYRFTNSPGESPVLRPFRLPNDIASKCWKAARNLGLLVAGIDLRRTPDGRWFCFEANPVAGFTYYQEATNHKIDDAIARLLLSSSR